MTSTIPISSLSALLSVQDQIAIAVKRADSILTRPSAIAADEFVRDWLASSSTHEELWQNLPCQLDILVERLEEMEENYDPTTCVYRYSNHHVETLSAAVFARAPRSLVDSFRQLFAEALMWRHSIWEMKKSVEAKQKDDNDKEDNTGEGDNPQLEFQEDRVYRNLRRLGWLSSFSVINKALMQAMHKVLAETVQKMIQGEFDSLGIWKSVQEWKNQVLKPWLMDAVMENSSEDEPMKNCNQQHDDWDKKIDFAVAEAFVNVRTEELFDIVADFPDSLPAVEELRGALSYTTHLHKMKLATSFRDSLQRRLLHPGANTTQILDVYINAVKVWRTLDPSDGLIETVANPVKKYLRERTDTVRCIITGLTDEKSGGELYEELRRQDAKLLEQIPDSDDEADEPDPKWQPAATPRQQAFASAVASLLGTDEDNSELTFSAPKQVDILAKLVGIYGSQELFVNEYRLLLADKLLGILDFDTDKEVHTLELLKLRFGEQSLRQCEIMIKDIDDSKRIVSNIHSTMAGKESSSDDPIEENPIVDAAIVSDIFWPSLMKEDLKVHPKIQNQLNQFSQEYGNLKKPRSLIWLAQLGTVQLELQLEDGELREFACTPLHATIVSHFEDKETWTAADLSNETGVSVETIRRRIGYWLNQRVLQTCTNSFGEPAYTLASSTMENDQISGAAGDGAEMMEEDEDDQVMSAKEAQEAEEMKVYESYIVGMLSNLGELSLDRIHNMLKMFVTGSDHKYDKTPQELSSFLQYLCKEDKLEFSADGMYKLLKK